jgi:hypothetical protein
MVKIGNTVRSTGRGKSILWGNYIGTVIEIIDDKFLINWIEPQFSDWMSDEEIEQVDNLKDITYLRFSDGVIIHTNGALRKIELKDGWYVAGLGKLIPVKNEEEGEMIIQLSHLN